VSGPLVSVVMPVYNAVAYLEDSVRSVLKQTIEELELIITDDQSIDGSWELLQTLAAEDSRIRLLRTETNSGAAKYPRELAVQAAGAEWICWVDADDLIEPEYLEKLFERAKQTGADLVCSRMKAFDPNTGGGYIIPRQDFDYSQIISGETAVMMTVGEFWHLNANGFLVRKELWQHTSTFCDPKVNQMNADDLATREMLLSAARVSFVQQTYHYRLHGSSITRNITSKLMEPTRTDMAVIRLISGHFGSDSSQAKAAYRQFYLHIIGYMRILLLKGSMFSDKERNRAYELVILAHKRCRFWRVVTTSHISAGKKLLLLLPFRVGMGLLKFVLR